MKLETGSRNKRSMETQTHSWTTMRPVTPGRTLASDRAKTNKLEGNMKEAHSMRSEDEENTEKRRGGSH